MRRRDVIAALGGAAAAVSWPLPARAQRVDQMRRIGVLMLTGADDPDGKARLAAFVRSLQQLGWTDGGNVRIDVRWGASSPELYRRYVTELLAAQPDVVLGTDSPIVATLQQASRDVPIVFVNITDPIGGGFVASLSHPGSNATGFTLFEYGTSAKWLELLKTVAPRVTRVAVLRDVSNTSTIGQLGAIQSAAPSFGVELSAINLREAGDIEHDIMAFAQKPNGGMIALATPSALVHRKLIIALAERHRLPAIYSYRLFVVDGGLISYGPDRIDQFRLAAGYVDRILKGEKPADLPVQNPTRYELSINRKTASALGLTVPDMLLATADEVIE
jgi:putative ABC transport system substrate-binding protein